MASGTGLEWFRPMWRRVAVTAFCAGWAAFEWLLNRDQLWGFIALAMTGWAVWTFFINYDKAVGPPAATGKDDHSPPPPGAPKS